MMGKLFFKLACIFFSLASPLSFSQETDLQTEEQSANQALEQKDFFDKAEAPLSYKGAFVKMMLTLFGLLALIVFTVWMLRRVSHGRMKQMNSGRSIKILERRPLSAKSILYLVEIGGKQVVVAESQIEVRAITTMDQLPLEED